MSKSKRAHNSLSIAEQLPSPRIRYSTDNDIHYFTNPKISLIRMGSGPKLFGLIHNYYSGLISIIKYKLKSFSPIQIEFSPLLV